jgi:hypothetical protein
MFHDLPAASFDHVFDDCLQCYLTIVCHVFDECFLCFLTVVDQVVWWYLTMLFDDCWSYCFRCLIVLLNDVWRCVWRLLTMFLFFNYVWRLLTMFLMLVDNVFWRLLTMFFMMFDHELLLRFVIMCFWRVVRMVFLRCLTMFVDHWFWLCTFSLHKHMDFDRRATTVFLNRDFDTSHLYMFISSLGSRPWLNRWTNITP